jgi:hypothetical protein
VAGKELFITENGSLGSLSSHCHAKVGDKIFVLLGANKPFVLRGLDSNQDYQLQGPCYVNGYMDGEAIRELMTLGETGEMKIETIRLH